MDKKVQWILIVAVLGILIVFMAILLQLRERDLMVTEQLQIRHRETTYDITGQMMNRINILPVEISGEESLYGYPVIDILDLLQIDENDYTRVFFSSRDGSRIAVDREEVLQRQVYLIPEGDDDIWTMRLVFPRDGFRNRWLKDIVLVETG